MLAATVDAGVIAAARLLLLLTSADIAAVGSMLAASWVARLIVAEADRAGAMVAASRVDRRRSAAILAADVISARSGT